MSRMMNVLKQRPLAIARRLSKQTNGKEGRMMTHILTSEELARILEAKKRAVMEGKSYVFENWHKFAGISAEEFIAALE